MNSRLGEPRECPSYFDIVCNEVGNPAHVRAQVDTKHQGNSFAVAGCFSVQRQIAFILKRKKSVMANNRRFLFIYLFFLLRIVLDIIRCCTCNVPVT
jgi:hypothetical protein